MNGVETVQMHADPAELEASNKMFDLAVPEVNLMGPVTIAGEQYRFGYDQEKLRALSLNVQMLAEADIGLPLVKSIKIYDNSAVSDYVGVPIWVPALYQMVADKQTMFNSKNKEIGLFVPPVQHDTNLTKERAVELLNTAVVQGMYEAVAEYRHEAEFQRLAWAGMAAGSLAGALAVFQAYRLGQSPDDYGMNTYTEVLVDATVVTASAAIGGAALTAPYWLYNFMVSLRSPFIPSYFAAKHAMSKREDPIPEIITLTNVNA